MPDQPRGIPTEARRPAFRTVDKAQQAPAEDIPSPNAAPPSRPTSEGPPKDPVDVAWLEYSRDQQWSPAEQDIAKQAWDAATGPGPKPVPTPTVQDVRRNAAAAALEKHGYKSED
jgi:hypothetical protein